MKYSLRYCTLNNCMILIALILATGCSGGIIGTATGPSTDTELKPTYRLKTLPSKLGPRIPKTLIATSPTESGSTMVNESLTSGVSRSWEQLSPSVTVAEDTRLNVQEVLTLLDSVFITALESCGTSSASCDIPAGTLQTQYTQEVINQLQTLVGYEAGDDATESAPFQAKLDSWLTFAGVVYMKLNNDLYDHYLYVEPLALLGNRSLELEWTEDASDISYSVQSEDDSDISEYYRYQNRPGGQHLNFHWDTDFEDELDPITFELNADSEDLGPVSYSAYLNGQTISGRASDSEGYASAMLYGQSDGSSDYFQESFSVFGELIDTRECEADEVIEIDCSLAAFDSALYVSESSFDEYGYEFELEYAEVTVSNIPSTIFEFEVRTNPTQDNATLVYCHGFQYPGEPPLSETFCFVEPSEMVDPIVVGFDEFGQEVLIENAIIQVSNAAIPSIE